MAKFVLYSDLHIRPERVEDCVKVLKVIGKVAKKENAIIINGGDTFHTRGLIRTSCYDALIREWSAWAEDGLTQYVLVGNHDQEDKAGEIHPLRALELFKSWKVIDKPTQIGRIMFFPYMDKITKKIVDETSGKCVYAVVHWGMTGAKMNSGYADPNGIPTDYLERFKFCWSGHYHYANLIKNIQYIGSPFEQNYGESGDKKGYWLWDTLTNKREFFEIKGLSKHCDVRIDVDEKGAKITEKDFSYTKKDFVRAKICGETSFVNALTKHEIAKICGETRSLNIKREPEDTSFSRLDIDRSSFTNNKELIGKFVDFSSTDLDKNKLKEIAMDIL